MSVCYECCGLSGRGLCDELIIRPAKSYRLCCVVVCENLVNEKALTHWRGCCAKNKHTNKHQFKNIQRWTNSKVNLPIEKLQSTECETWRLLYYYIPDTVVTSIVRFV
jgi:hypothetical protein